MEIKQTLYEIFCSLWALLSSLYNQHFASDFDESKHPRRADGKFGDGEAKEKNSIDTEEIKRYNNLLLKIKVKSGQQVKRVSLHTIQRCKERGIAPEEIAETLREPRVLLPVQTGASGRPSQVFMGKRISVAFNPENGTITTAWVKGE